MLYRKYLHISRFFLIIQMRLNYWWDKEFNKIKYNKTLGKKLVYNVYKITLKAKNIMNISLNEKVK